MKLLCKKIKSHKCLEILEEVVNRVDRRADDLSKKSRKRGERTEPSFEEKNTELRKRKCKFYPQYHV